MHAVWLDAVMEPDKLKFTADWATEIIHTNFPDVDYLASSGLSGNLLCGIVSVYTNKHLFVCRKLSEHCHSSREEEFHELAKGNLTAVIIDDFISGGSTVKRIYDGLVKNKVKLVGIILYDDHKNFRIQLVNENDREIPTFVMQDDGVDRLYYIKKI